jgi:G3E family GTPase
VIPTHLICGPLGIGKTTAIIDYLRRHAADQFTAVLVNDFGPVGLDAAIMEADLGSAAKDNMSIHMLPGGCVCCTAAAGLIGAIEQLSAMPRLDRIIIEPSGLALVGGMIDLVLDLADKHSLELRPVIALVEPRLLDRPGFHAAPYYVRVVEAADILVANRCDLASPAQIAAFDKWAADLFPPKLRILKTQQGHIPDEVFDLRYDHQPQRHSPHTTAHSAPEQAGGTSWPADVCFSNDAILDLLGEWSRIGFVGNDVLRIKSLLRTNDGWKLFEIARGQVYHRSTDYRRDNRIDWITSGPVLDEVIREQFERCLWK